MIFFSILIVQIFHADAYIKKGLKDTEIIINQNPTIEHISFDQNKQKACKHSLYNNRLYRFNFP